MSAGKRFFGYLAVFSKHSEKYTPLSLLRVFKNIIKIEIFVLSLEKLYVN